MTTEISSPAAVQCLLFCGCVQPNQTAMDDFVGECAEVAIGKIGYQRTRVRAPRTGDVYKELGLIAVLSPPCTNYIDSKAACIVPFSVKGTGPEPHVCVASPSAGAIIF